MKTLAKFITRYFKSDNINVKVFKKVDIYKEILINHKPLGEVLIDYFKVNEFEYNLYSEDDIIEIVPIDAQTIHIYLK